MSEQLPHDEELRSLYRKLPADEPRAEVDEAILSAARALADATARERREAHERQRRRFRERAGLLVPLAAAASVILTLTLTRLTPEQQAVAPARLDEARDESMATRQAPSAATPERDANLLEPEEAPSSAYGEAEEAPAFGYGEPEELMAEETPMPVPNAAPEKQKESAKPASRPSASAGAAAPPAQEPKARADSDAVAASKDAGADDARPFARLSPLAAKKAVPAQPPAVRQVPTEPAAVPEAAGAYGEAEEPLAEEAPMPAPASPPSAAAGAAAARLGDTASSKKAELSAAAGPSWPFGLEPRLDSAEACRRASAALKTECRFDADTAVMNPAQPVAADRGEFAGRKVSRLTLVSANGALSKIILQVEGYTTGQVLVAPPAP